MSFTFETPADRRGTDSQKWQRYAGRDVLPLWVADMDFPSPPAVLDALHRRVDHGIFGYARPTAATVEAVLGSFERRYGWRVDPDWLVWLPGLVCGLNVTARAFATAGDEILCLTPVYPPFMTAPRNQERVARPVPLALNRRERRWEIDWDALEKAVGPRTRMLQICHPHNPIARVWTRGEIARTVDFCRRHGIVLCSDEIHCDLILDADTPHVPAALAGEGPIVTLMAPSKTYNVPGLGTSLAIIPDASLRNRFTRAAAGIVAEVTTLGYAACEAAYRDGEPWRQALLAYLRDNRDLLVSTLARDLPGVRLEAPVEATYLAWLHVGDLGLPNPAAHFEAHGVGLSDGAPFGAAPGQYVRLNFGCPRSTLREALARMTAALAAVPR